MEHQSVNSLESVSVQVSVREWAVLFRPFWWVPMWSGTCLAFVLDRSLARQSEGWSDYEWVHSLVYWSEQLSELQLVMVLAQ
mmetsp:Transcript_48107/g.79748  ORF Transcript_48107/g.79748 Transcript_48107/m.79748 type:complete len:82 (-) Transcript_48107:404-649(-)